MANCKHDPTTLFYTLLIFHSETQFYRTFFASNNWIVALANNCHRHTHKVSIKCENSLLRNSNYSNNVVHCELLSWYFGQNIEMKKKTEQKVFFSCYQMGFASFPFNCVFFICVSSFQEHRFSIINTLESFFPLCSPERRQNY